MHKICYLAGQTLTSSMSNYVEDSYWVVQTPEDHVYISCKNKYKRCKIPPDKKHQGLTSPERRFLRCGGHTTKPAHKARDRGATSGVRELRASMGCPCEVRGKIYAPGSTEVESLLTYISLTSCPRHPCNAPGNGLIDGGSNICLIAALSE